MYVGDALGRERGVGEEETLAVELRERRRQQVDVLRW